MSDTYRGFPIPTPEFDSGWYYIADPKFGWFWGYIPEAALLHWRNKVDSDIIEDALAMDLIERTGNEELSCKECGLKIHDVFLHLKWHKTH